MSQLFPTMTPDIMAQLIRAARRRRNERRGAWRNAINNLSSGVESRHAKVTLKREGSARLECKDHSGVVTHTQLAGVAPGLLNNFRPATTAKSEDVSCVVSTSDAASCEGSQGGATSASASADSAVGARRLTPG